RKELIFYLKVSDVSGEIGRLIDVHREGLLILSPKKLKKESVYDLKIETPKKLWEQNLRLITAKAQCIHVTASLTRPYWENGCKFLEMDSLTQLNIELLINLFAMPTDSAQA
ncbi:MAG: hypothetical protein LBV23_11490, partial [Deltaproteobacteria bacterium]|nr:hypothetical protein [Deltaproteobacteria bacterium]